MDVQSFATVEGNEVFPDDADAGEGGASEVGDAGRGTVGRVGHSEGLSDLGPGGVVDASHGLVVGVGDVVLQHGGGGLVGEGGQDLGTAWGESYSL